MIGAVGPSASRRECFSSSEGKYIRQSVCDWHTRFAVSQGKLYDYRTCCPRPLVGACGVGPSEESSLALLGQKNSRFSEGDRDGIALGKRAQAAPSARVGHLREDLPALAQHLPDVSVHLFHAEEPLPVEGSVPASLVGEGFDLQLKTVRVPASKPDLPFQFTEQPGRLYHAFSRIFWKPCRQPCVARHKREGHSARLPPYGGVIPERISVLTCWMWRSD